MRPLRQALWVFIGTVAVGTMIVSLIPVTRPAADVPVPTVAGPPAAAGSFRPVVVATGSPVPVVRSPSPVPSPPPQAPPTPAGARPKPGLDDPHMTDIAMRLVSSAENSSLDWRAQYRYIEDIDDGRGYTAGIIGFCSGTGDMLDLVELYTRRKPSNLLAKYLPALREVDGSSSHGGLDPTFTQDWATAARDAAFQRAQEDLRDSIYLRPAIAQARADGLRTLGQFVYFDAIVMHGPGSDPVSFGGIRAAALRHAKPPAQGGDEARYLDAFLDARVAAMRAEAAHEDTSRIDTAQRVFLRAANFDLATPLSWAVYGDKYYIAS